MEPNNATPEVDSDQFSKHPSKIPALNQKGLLVSIFVALLVVFTGGYFLYQKQANNVDSPHLISQPIQSPISNEIINWKTYSSTLFSFKYPPHMDVGNVKNSVLIFGPTNKKTTQDLFDQRDTYKSQFGQISSSSIDGHPAFMRRVTLNNAGFPLSNITDIAIENVRFYEDNQWFTNGVLFLSIHIDGDKIAAENIAKLIIDTIVFIETNNKENMAITLENLEFNIRNTFWYDCIDYSEPHFSQCRINTNENPYENNSMPHYFLQFYPNGSKIYHTVDKNILKDIKETSVKISAIDTARIDGVVDPLKYTEGSSFYDQNDHVSIVTIETKEGTYIFTGVVTQGNVLKNFNHLLSTFKFIK